MPQIHTIDKLEIFESPSHGPMRLMTGVAILLFVLSISLIFMG